MKFWEKLIALVCLIAAFVLFMLSGHLMVADKVLYAFLSVFSGLICAAISVSLWYYKSILPSNRAYDERMKNKQ